MPCHWISPVLSSAITNRHFTLCTAKPERGDERRKKQRHKSNVAEGTQLSHSVALWSKIPVYKTRRLTSKGGIKASQWTPGTPSCVPCEALLLISSSAGLLLSPNSYPVTYDIISLFCLSRQDRIRRKDGKKNVPWIRFKERLKKDYSLDKNRKRLENVFFVRTDSFFFGRFPVRRKKNRNNFLRTIRAHSLFELMTDE